MKTQKESKLAGHTPGPWDFRIVPGSTPARVTVSDRSDRNEHVALCYGGEHDALANARLIAAAPELLEAAAALDLHMMKGGDMHQGHQLHVALRAAIAKAEGK